MTTAPQKTRWPHLSHINANQTTIHSDLKVFVIPALNFYKKKPPVSPPEGKRRSAIAMTEPGAGSDLQAIKNGDHYVLNGSKTFITNGQMADVVVVVAKTNHNEGAKGISLFVVEAN
jgi:hypothetical protein